LLGDRVEEEKRKKPAKVDNKEEEKEGRLCFSRPKLHTKMQPRASLFELI
jgi:hypothetical protein